MGEQRRLKKVNRGGEKTRQGTLFFAPVVKKKRRELRNNSVEGGRKITGRGVSPHHALSKISRKTLEPHHLFRSKGFSVTSGKGPIRDPICKFGSAICFKDLRDTKMGEKEEREEATGRFQQRGKGKLVWSCRA